MVCSHKEDKDQDESTQEAKREPLQDPFHGDDPPVVSGEVTETGYDVSGRDKVSNAP